MGWGRVQKYFLQEITKQIAVFFQYQSASNTHDSQSTIVVSLQFTRVLTLLIILPEIIK